MKQKLIILSTLFSFPMLTSAQQLGSFRDIIGMALTGSGYVMRSIFALFSLGIIYTVFKYIAALNSGDGKSAGEMRERLIWGVVGMAVLFSLWGIIYLLSGSLGWSESVVGIPVLKAPRL
jgi:hypothetical protein